MTDNIVFNLTPAEVPTIERKGSNERARQYDAIVAAVKAQPGQSFRAVERHGTQAMVAALKGRGVWAGLRNTWKGGKDNKTTFGDLYVLYEPTTPAPAPTPTETTTAPENDVPARLTAPGGGEPTLVPTLPLQGHGAPGDATFTASVPAAVGVDLAGDAGSIANLPVDDDGMPIT